MFGRKIGARRRLIEAARTLYDVAVVHARQPVFYTDMGVPDTVDGRFEMLTIHVVLIVGRLSEGGEETQPLAQALFDTMFDDMDRSLREMGVGDLSVGKHIRRMGQGFYGRAAAYETGLRGDDAALEEAIRRNLYGTLRDQAIDSGAIAHYMRLCAVELTAQPLEALSRGEVRFPPPAAR
ncbi:MAG: hypothetical protein CMM50_12215 [Rhodospirillaceae bacterium]|nr:hypothetical protein [Rhodospirillaceae bacterium]